MRALSYVLLSEQFLLSEQLNVCSSAAILSTIVWDNRVFVGGDRFFALSREYFASRRLGPVCVRRRLSVQPSSGTIVCSSAGIVSSRHPENTSQPVGRVPCVFKRISSWAPPFGRHVSSWAPPFGHRI
jgi:hypothetical protein